MTRAAVVGSLLLAALLLAQGTFAVAGADDPSSTTYRMIVNPANPRTSTSRVFVAEAFLKKVRRWPQGDAIEPIDLNEGSAVRRRYSQEVLRRSVAAVKSYWQQMIFSGRELPPPETDSDDDVVNYVLRHPGAIGYVSGGANLRGARVLSLEE